MLRKNLCPLLFAFVCITPTSVSAQEIASAPEVTLQEQAEAIPQERRDRVHVFFINGVDPFYSANLNGLAAHYRSIGFVNTSCWQMAASWKVRREIECVRRRDPEARIVLVGYSLGANCARSIANKVQCDGIRIDCLVYLAGDTIADTPSSRPANVGRVVNINAHGFLLLGRDLFLNGEEISGAANHRIDVRHFGLPTQNNTINLIGKEIIALANP